MGLWGGIADVRRCADDCFPFLWPFALRGEKCIYVFEIGCISIGFSYPRPRLCVPGYQAMP